MLKTHHVGYLVKNIEKSKEEFKKLGYILTSEVIHDEARKIKICFMDNFGVVIELVEPDEDCEFLKGLKKKIGVGTYHICYECDDFERERNTLLDSGYLEVQEPAKAIAIDGRRVSFMFAPDIGLIELLEEKGA